MKIIKDIYYLKSERKSLSIQKSKQVSLLSSKKVIIKVLF